MIFVLKTNMIFFYNLLVPFTFNNDEFAILVLLNNSEVVSKLTFCSIFLPTTKFTTTINENKNIIFDIFMQSVFISIL